MTDKIRMLPKFTKFVILIIVLLLICGVEPASLFADETLSPAIHLSGYDGTDPATHHADNPLILYVFLMDVQGRRAEDENKANQEMIKKLKTSDRFKEWTREEQKRILDRLKKVDTPEVTLGSNAKPVSSLIDFVVKNDAGKTVDIHVRALKSNEKVKNKVSLNTKKPASFYYVIESGELKKLSKGVYTITSVFNTEGIKRISEEAAVSNPLKITLLTQKRKLSKDELNQDLYMKGDMHLLDENYAEARNVAEQIIANDPDFIGGWLHKGDALAGLGQKAEARTAFEKALDLYGPQLSDNKFPINEPPDYILERLKDLES